jgi:large subunit ribosomal protein L17
MRHKIKGKRLNRTVANRNALRKNMIKQFLQNERIQTTKAKAAFIRGDAEKLISLAKRGVAAEDPARTIHARRLAQSRLSDPEVVKKLFDEIAPRYAERPGGYTRVIKIGWRDSDKADMVVLELVE